MAKGGMLAVVGVVALVVGVGIGLVAGFSIGRMSGGSTDAATTTTPGSGAPASRPAAGGGKRVTLDLGGGVKMEFASISAGTYTRGSPILEEGRYNDEFQHQVTLSKPFHMGIHPVTQEQYEAVMGLNPSNFKEGRDAPRRPVEQVTWDNAITFCRMLSEKTGRSVRLPTEAEWEYACRAGTTTAYSFGNSLSREQANFGGNFNSTTPVGTFPANAWGLFDMHGNVWEWCMDWKGEYPEGAVTDPKGPRDGSSRVLRGGSWDNPPRSCRSANRSDLNPDGSSYYLGFRVVLD